MSTTKRMTSKLERHLLESMFEKSLFADLSLVFLHPAFPFAMRFNVHKSIISQSPFLCKLLKSMDALPNSKIEHNDIQITTNEYGITTLTIDLAKALTQCGFVLAPFQHIVRRKWQRTASTPTNANREKDSLSPLLSSHIRFVLKWMYCLNKQELLESMHDKDTLRILSVAVLLDVHDLSQACVNRYTREQLSLDSVMRDLETICQLPRGHSAYLQLRDAALLLLFRFGPENANRLAMLPVDYMADVLSADPLYVSSEYERYCLLRAVLMAFMQSVGKITWTPKGPVDQDAKRLSGFVRPLSSSKTSKYDHGKFLTADAVRSRKRKRIPSEDLEDGQGIDALQQQPHLNRLSFTALVPFEKLVADVASGGVIDKATVLSYLLRTTVNYSNMTFDQLTSVRQDGIVDEGIVFRALWQREALERVLFPLTFTHQTQEQHTIPRTMEDDRSAALDEYFDVDHSDAQEKRRRLLLGTPRFRFRASVFVTPPSEENGWVCEQKEVSVSTVDMHAFDDDDDDDSDGSVWSASDSEEPMPEESMTDSQTIQAGVEDLNVAGPNKRKTNTKTISYTMYRKMFYSEAETILGTSYRLQIEAQVIPRHRLDIRDELEKDEDEEEQFYVDHDPNENVMVCRFELQRDMKRIALPSIQIKKEKGVKKSSTTATSTSTASSALDNVPDDKTKIHYWIHCLNRHEGILENDRIDPEDRVLVAVTEQCERENGEPGEMGPGYVGQVLIDADLKKGVTVDATVALEIFGFQKV